MYPSSRSGRVGARAGRFFATVTFAIALLGAFPVGAVAPDAGLASIAADYWAGQLDLHPLLGLAQGEESARERFDESLSDSWLRRAGELERRTSTRLDGVDQDHLLGSDRVTYRMLRFQLAQAHDYLRHLHAIARRLPIDQFQGLHTVYAADAAGAGSFPFRTVADYDHALARARAYARWTDQAVARMREGVRTGVVLPRLVVERILPQLSAHAEGDPELSEFWRPIADMPTDFPVQDKLRLTAAFRRSISEVIQPAYRRLHDYLRDEYLIHARRSAGLGQLPGGKALYRYYVAQHTTTLLTPRAIHVIGLREVDRLTSEMANVRRLVGFAGPPDAFYDYVRGDPDQRFANAQDVLPAYDAQRMSILPRLAALFHRLPRAAYEVRALPESARASQGNGYYAPPAADGSRPGVLWINIYAPGVRDRFNVTTISLHEGLPGHHLQTALGQECDGLPAFRRFDETTAYVEGWGLYAESLGAEMGLYSDPWQHYGHLNYAMLRANRLVVDTGIHALGWTVRRAVRFMVDHSSMTEEQATAEVERYVAAPGQALAYKVGELKIRELRDRAAAALGPAFDLRNFHDAVLLEGSMPLSILESHVDEWIARSLAQRRP